MNTDNLLRGSRIGYESYGSSGCDDALLPIFRVLFLRRSCICSIISLIVGHKSAEECVTRKTIFNAKLVYQ